MDEREKDTREQIRNLEIALSKLTDPKELFELHQVAEVALEFRSTDEMIGRVPLDETLLDELRMLSRHALQVSAGRHLPAALALAQQATRERDSFRAAAAFEALTKLAPHDLSGQSEVQLSYLWSQGLGGRTGDERDRQRALESARAAASKNNPDGLVEVGSLLYESDRKAAREHYERAAALGHPRGIFNLAYFVEMGDGYDRDEVKAFELYRRAADGGHARGAAVVGIMAYQGRGQQGLVSDLSIAKTYLQMATDGGFLWPELAAAMGADATSIRTMANLTHYALGDEHEDEDTQVFAL